MDLSQIIKKLEYPPRFYRVYIELGQTLRRNSSFLRTNYRPLENDQTDELNYLNDKSADKAEPQEIIEEEFEIEQINSTMNLWTDSNQEHADGTSEVGSASHLHHTENVSTPMSSFSNS